MTRPKKCSPHRWNVEDWLPLYKGTDITIPELTCRNCGRVLAVGDTTPNMRASIADGIASRLFKGDEYAEVHDAVTKYFTYQIQNPPPANRYDRKPIPEAGRTETGLIDKPTPGSLRMRAAVTDGTVKRQAIVDDYIPKGGLPQSTLMARYRRAHEGSTKGQVPESPPRRPGGR